MAKRKIVRIDEDKCNGCGDCIVNCPEGALQIVDGKARLVKESYCDGLGACLGNCPLDAITIEERDADEFDEEAVKKHMEASAAKEAAKAPAGCPGSRMRQMAPPAAVGGGVSERPSQLSHWPIQLGLVPPGAPFLEGADLLLVADCVPFSLADFHERFLHGRPVVVGCPKLDDAGSHVKKLTSILSRSSVKSLTIVHMEVPCCKGLCSIARGALQAGGLNLPVSEVTVSVDGRVISEEKW